MKIKALFDKNSRYQVKNPPLLTYNSVRGINIDFIIALTPAAVWGLIAFGLRAFVVLLISVLSAVLAEFLWNLALRRSQTISDLSAVLTGFIIGLMLPASVAYWMPAAGSLVAIIFFKQIPNLFGKRFVNPAVGGYAFLTIWQSELTQAPEAFTHLSAAAFSFPKAEVIPVDTSILTENGTIFKLQDLITGTGSGAIGAISPLILIAGCIYLVWRKIISWKFPAYMLGSAAILFALFPLTLNRMNFMFHEIFSGLLMLSLIVSCSDSGGLPVTESGREIYALGCGCLCVFFRYFTTAEEGVIWSVIAMNLLARPIDLLITKPHVFGSGKQTDRDKKSKKNPYDPFENGPDK